MFVKGHPPKRLWAYSGPIQGPTGAAATPTRSMGGGGGYEGGPHGAEGHHRRPQQRAMNVCVSPPPPREWSTFGLGGGGRGNVVSDPPGPCPGLEVPPRPASLE